MRKIVILGATGSIGTSVLSVIRDNPGEFYVSGLAVRRPSGALLRLAGEFPHAMLAVAEEPDAEFLGRVRGAGNGREVLFGEGAAERLMEGVEAEVCVAAISGTAGLGGAFVAAERGMRVLLANKEVLVSAGELFMSRAKSAGAVVLPLDSEHAAVWQCLEGRDRDRVRRVVITASGGPFWRMSAREMEGVGPEEALRHPVWRMGAKITVDSATLANKALEVMEARCLFGIEGLDVLVHPQSVVHGMVEWRDGSVMAHMGVCDMRQPIGYMMFYPGGAEWRRERVDLAAVGGLEFYEPDYGRFPLMRIGLEAGRVGGMAPAYFNAANEEVVGMFLAGRVGFGGMAAVVEGVMEEVPGGMVEGVGQVMEAHERARALAREKARLLAL